MGHEGIKKHPPENLHLPGQFEPWQQFEPFLNRLDEAVVLLNSEKKILFLNQKAFDLSPVQKEWVGQTFVGLDNLQPVMEQDFFLQPGDGVPVIMKTFSTQLNDELFTIILVRTTDGNHTEMHKSSVIDNSGVGFYRSKPDGHLLYSNKGLLNMLGYPDHKSLARKNPRDLMAGSTEKLKDISRRLKSRQTVQNEEILIKCFDGSKKYVEFCVNPIFDPKDGSLLYFEGTVQDITARKQNEQVQRDSEMRLRTITEQNLDGIIIIDENKTILGWNLATEEIIGLKAEEVLNKSYLEIMELINAEVIEYLSSEPSLENLSDVSMTRRNRFMSQIGFHIQKPDGSQRDIEVIPFPIQEREMNLVGVFLRDSTERLQTEARLKRQVEELRILNDVAKAGAEATDEDSLIGYVARRVGEQFFPDYFGVMMVDDSKKYLYGYYSNHLPEEDTQQNWKIPLGMGIAGSVALTGVARRVGDVSQDNDYIIINPETCSELCVPMMTGGEILGVLKIESPKYHAYHEGDENLLKSVADQLSTAIVKIRLVKTERRRRLEAETLSRASYSLVSSLDLHESLNSYLEFLSQVIRCDEATILLKEKGDNLRVAATKGFDNIILQTGTVIEADHMMAKPLLGITQPLQLDDFTDQMNYLSNHHVKHPPVVLAVPLILRRNVNGYLLLSKKSGQRFSERDISLAKTFANHAAVAIDNAYLFADTRRRATEMEALTGVSMALRKAESSKDMIPILVEKSVELFNAPAVSFYTLERDMLELVGAYGPAEQYLKSCFPFIEEEIYWKIVYSGEALVNPGDIEREKLANSYIFNMTMGGTLLGGAILPLKSPDSVVGLLHIALEDDRNLSEDDSRLLMAMAEVVANALNRAIIMETLEQRVTLRISQLATLYMISSIASENLPLEELLVRMLEKMLEAMESQTGIIMLLDDSKQHLYPGVYIGVPEKNQTFLQDIPVYGDTWDWRTWLFDEPEPLATSDILTDERLPNDLYIEGFPSVIATPIRLNRRTLGVMFVMGNSLEAFSAEDLGLLAVISEQVGSTIENTRLRKQAEEIAVIEERQRLARELHDSVTQSLYSVFLMANGARKLALSHKMERCIHYLRELSQTSEEALKEMRLLIYQLRPAALEQEGLQEAIRKRLEVVERRAGICTEFSGHLQHKLPPDVEDGVYRIVMESLNNILKHARATSVHVALMEKDNQTVIEIQDNGIGFDTCSPHAIIGIGLNSMRERAEKMGGELLVRSAHGEGTLIKIIIKQDK